MNWTIEDFINYLNKRIKIAYQHYELKSETSSLDDLVSRRKQIDTLLYLKRLCIAQSDLFYDIYVFNTLSDLLNESSFNVSECFNITMFYIKRYIDGGVLYRDDSIYFKTLKEYYFDNTNYINEDNVDNIIYALSKIGIKNGLLLEFKYYLNERVNNKNYQRSEKVREKYIRSITTICEESVEAQKNVSTLDNVINRETITALTFDLASFASFLKYPAHAHKSRVIVSDFRMLESAILEANVSISENVCFYFDLIKENISNGILNSNSELIDVKEFLKMKAELQNRLINETSSSNIVNNYARIFRDMCMSEERDESKVMDLTGSINYEGLRIIRISHELIRDHYFNKPDFNKMDIASIIFAFKSLGVTSKMLAKISIILEKEIEKREKNKKDNSEYIQKKEIRDIKPIVSKKTYYVVRSELLKFFDFDNMKPFRYLKLDEIIYCVALMKKINIKEEMIEEFIRLSERFNRSYNKDAKEMYLELRDKIEYYSSNPEIASILEEIDYVFSEMNKDSSDYAYLSEYMSMEIGEAVRLIPESHEFEYKAADELLKEDKILKNEP